MAISATGPVDGAFDELMQRLESIVERLRRAIQKIFDAANRAIGVLPGYIADQVREKLLQFRDVVQKFMGKLRDALDGPGHPGVLEAAAESWYNSVALQTTDVVNVMQGMNVDDYWKGSAAQAYKTTLGKQEAAFDAMKDLGNRVRTTLKEAADGISGFWHAVFGIIVAALALIVAAAALVAGGITAPLGVAAAIGAIVVAIGGIVTAIVTLSEKLGEVSQAIPDLQAAHETSTAFAGAGDGQWPAATTTGEWKAD